MQGDPGSGAIPDADLAAALDAFAARDRVLVALDFDGTLAPIVDDPDAARVLPRAADALAVLAAQPHTHVAIVSGRSLDQLRRLVPVTSGVALVGSHGAQIDTSGLPSDDDDGGAGTDDGDLLDEDELRMLGRLREAVAQIVRAHPGTVLEEKPAAVVLHTRTAERDAAGGATGDVLHGPGRWPGVHVLRGKEVVELAVSDVTKGRALRRLRADLGLEHGGVLFAGDDATDERAFDVLDDAAGDVTVKVGDGETAARHRVAGPEELAHLLELLARRRRTP